MKDSDTERLLEELVMQIQARELPAFPRELMAARLAALTKGHGAPREAVQRATSGWRPWQVLAAGVLATAVVVVAFWLLPAVEDKRALAFADVQKAVEAAQTMRFRILHYSSDPGYLAQYNVKAGEPTVSQLYFAGNRVRSEQPLGMVSVIDFDKGLTMFIQQRQRLAEIFPIHGTEMLKKSADFRTKLRNLAESGAKRLPDRQMNGRTVSEFVMRLDDQDFTVTVDPRTNLPIRMEVVYTKRPQKGQGEMREVYTDFVFDAPLDETLFRIAAPAGYEVVNRVPRNSEPNPPESIKLVISPEDGIGPVKFGTKVAEIVRLLGEPDWRHDEDNAWRLAPPKAQPDAEVVKPTGTELGYDRRGFRLLANEDRGLYSIHCFNNRGGVVSTETGYRGKTKEGIALGASLDDVLKTYGQPEAQMHSRLVWYRKRGYEFMFDDKKLVSIRVSPPNPNIQTEIEVRGDQIIERVKSRK
jgi:hypothetical protein